MKVMQKGVLLLSLLVAGLCQASDTEDLVQDSQPRYNASQIIQQIKESSLESYVKDDLLIDKNSCLQIKEDNLTIVQLIETKIDEINGIMKQEQPKLVQNWKITCIEGVISLSRAPVKHGRWF